MAKIGNWGNGIKFQTSDSRILTFTDLKRKVSARTNKHNMIHGKPKLEFLGMDLQTVTFRMELNALLGVRPQKVEEKLADPPGGVLPGAVRQSDRAFPAV